MLQGYGELDLHTTQYTQPTWRGSQKWKTSTYITADADAADGTDPSLASADDPAPADTSGVRWTGVRWTGVRWS